MFPNFALLLLLNPQNEVLLVRRINTPFCNNHYSLPGGKIEYGETARETVIREAKNSLGVTITLDDLTFVHVMYRKCNEPEFAALVFQTHTWQGILSNQELERHDDLQWFTLDNLPHNMVPAHKYALESIQQQLLYSEHGWKRENL